jgi:hypothetical protein
MQAFSFGPLSYASPQAAHDFLCAFVIAFVVLF